MRVVFEPLASPSTSPYRLVDGSKREPDWANRFLDAQKLRRLSPCSLRAYAYDLLNLARWFEAASVDLPQLTESMLVDYVRFQSDRQPAAQTVNHRLYVARCVYRFHYGRDIPGADDQARSQHLPFRRGRVRRVVRKLRIKTPGRVMVPLSPAQVSSFWSSFHTFRDLGMVALMLFNGLRSREVLGLKLEDLLLTQKQILVHGKGNRERILPMDPQTIKVLESYLRVERPLTNSPVVFVVLKGPGRGNPLSPAGLRSLFRHHRTVSEVLDANPHRFRHTFGTDMVRAGISLPALMRLMGHSHIETTMLYVRLCPRDVWNEFHRVVQNMRRAQLPEVL